MATFIFDTREQKNQHIKDYFDRRGINYIVKKLDEGDYQIDGKPNISVDRKQNLDEIYNCLVNDKSRFMREVRRCYDKHIKLYVLIEHGGQIKSIADVSKWRSKYGHISGRDIVERLHKLQMAYGVEIVFCDKKDTAEYIIKILINREMS